MVSATSYGDRMLKSLEDGLLKFNSLLITSAPSPQARAVLGRGATNCDPLFELDIDRCITGYIIYVIYTAHTYIYIHIRTYVRTYVHRLD